MKWKELFCNHDWYTLKAKSKNEILAEITGSELPCEESRIQSVYRERICLNCEKHIDEIKDKKSQMIADTEYKERRCKDRKRRAHEIITRRFADLATENFTALEKIIASEDRSSSIGG